MITVNVMKTFCMTGCISKCDTYLITDFYSTGRLFTWDLHPVSSKLQKNICHKTCQTAVVHTMLLLLEHCSSNYASVTVLTFNRNTHIILTSLLFG